MTPSGIEPATFLCFNKLRHRIPRLVVVHGIINILTPNVNYSGRTAPLTSKVSIYIFIQQIYVLNIFNTVYTLGYFLFKMQFVS